MRKLFKAEEIRLAEANKLYGEALRLLRNALFNAFIAAGLIVVAIIVIYMTTNVIHWLALMGAVCCAHFNGARLYKKARVLGVKADKLYGSVPAYVSNKAE